MKKIYLFLIFILAGLGLFYACDAMAANDKIEEIIEKLVAGTSEKDVMENYLYFDGTTIWILICCFGLSFGMISLSSSVAKHFVGAGGGSGEAGQMAYSTVTKTAAAGLAVAGGAGRFGRRWLHEHSKNNELEQTRSAGNKTYEAPQQPSGNAADGAGAGGSGAADGGGSSGSHERTSGADGGTPGESASAGKGTSTAEEHSSEGSEETGTPPSGSGGNKDSTDNKKEDGKKNNSEESKENTSGSDDSSNGDSGK